MTQRYKSWVWFWSTLVFLVVSVGVTIWQVVTIDRHPPITVFYRSETMNSPLYPGEVLVVRTFRDKVRDDCPLTAEIFVLNVDGETFPAGTVKTPGAPASKEYAEISYELPSLPPGQYFLRVALAYHCPNITEPFVYDQPTALFRIKEGVRK